MSNIKFGVMLQGAGSHMNSWKHPGGPADASVNLDFFVRTAKKAEDNGIAFAFVADGLYINEKSIPHFLNRFEPISILSALATVTSKIGLGGHGLQLVQRPVHGGAPVRLARPHQRRARGLERGDHAAGRQREELQPHHPEHAQRYEIADEYLAVTQGLWDSWDDDAFTRNRESGQFFDRDKLHTLDHKGRFFQVAGPLNIQRSPQGSR
jgi:alkanesulfonate monooxygenase SsuD/methylene tetrahydromethanopterin reductase-like flavin-dependent oxidoreductase (luciferase family)